MKKKILFTLLGTLLFPLTLVSCGEASESTVDPTTTTEPVVVKYTVAFEVDGARYKTLKVKEGSKIEEEVPNPTKEGYIFTGWYLSGELIDLSTYVVTKDVTFVAQFKEDDGDQLNVDDTKDALKSYTLVLGWWEVNDPAEPDKVTSGLTKTSVRMFYANVIKVLKAKGKTDDEIKAISFRNYSSAKVADMGALVNADGDVDLLIGVGANVFTTAGCLPYDTSENSKFQTSMGEKTRYVALLKDARDLGKDLYSWLQTDIGKKSFLQELSDEEIAKSLAPVTINLTVTVHGDTDAVTTLTDETTAITMPVITVPENKEFAGFALTSDGEVVLDKAIDASLKYADLKALVKEGEDTLNLYPIFKDKEVSTVDLTVYVQTGSKLSTIEVKLLEARFNASLTDGSKVSFVTLEADAAGFTEGLGKDADVVIGGNNPLKNYTAHADGVLVNAGAKHFADSSRKVLILSTVNSAHLELAKKFYNFVQAEAVEYNMHTTFWGKEGAWVTADEVSAIKTAITNSINSLAAIGEAETLLDKYNVKLDFYEATNTKVAELGAETNALQNGKGTDLIIGCGANVTSTGGVEVIEKKTIDTSIVAANRYVALVKENPIARYIYENYFVAQTPAV